ncbi:MAG: MotA/TolQ/ExbB proton channel family protein, partial [Rhodospirillales bacterium]|nr:MotA/TolQ/ExbB proton channel family protein [Rhodospirillales bacterium]
MDITTVVGLITGIAVVTLAIMTGSDLGIFLNIPGILIVIGGTFAATLIKFPLSTVWTAFTVGLRAVFVSETDDPRALIDQAIKLTRQARKRGLVGLEKVKVSNSFFKKGIQLCADNHELDFIRTMLTKEMDMAIQRQEISARVFMAIGDSAPAFGMFGTLVGLVQMLSQMDDPTRIGQGMAVALLTTLYGVLIAHLAALPIADKLLAKTEQERDNRMLIMESIVQIHNKQNPSFLVEILESHLPEKLRRGEEPGGRPRRRASDRVPGPGAAA